MAMTGGTAKLVKTSTTQAGTTVKLYVYYKSTQDTTNNKSTITMGMYVNVSSGHIGDWTDSGNGSYLGKTSNTFNGSIPYTGGTYWIAENKTMTVNHDSDGKATATIYWKWNVNSSWGGMVTPSGSFSITLPQIPVASGITATNAYIGNATTITLSVGKSTYRHTLYYSLNGGTSYTQITTNVQSSYQWTLPTSLYNSLSSTSKTLTITLKAVTFDGSTNKGEKTCTITATAKESVCKPTINPSIVDNNSTTLALTGDSSKFIKYFSNASISVNPTYKYGASSSTVKVVCGAKTLNSASGTITAVESATFAITVTDSRGFSTTETVTKTLIDYIKPTVALTINSINASSGAVNYTITGNAFSGSLGNQNNIRGIAIRYKETSSNTWGSWTTCSPTTYDSEKKQYSYTSNLNLDYTKQYNIQAGVKDSVVTTRIESNIETAIFSPLFYWGKDEFNFNVPVTFTEELDEDEPEKIEMADIIKDIYFMDGESVTLGFNGGGYITTSGKQLNFTVPIRKSTKRVNKVTVNSMTIAARQGGNYIIGSGSANADVTGTGYTITVGFNDNFLSVRVVKSTAYTNATNNDATGVCANITVTFSRDANFSTDSYEEEILIIGEDGEENGE